MFALEPHDLISMIMNIEEIKNNEKLNRNAPQIEPKWKQIERSQPFHPVLQFF